MSLTATDPLADLGIKTATIHLNPGVDALYADAIRLGEGVQAACGPSPSAPTRPAAAPRTASSSRTT